MTTVSSLTKAPTVSAFLKATSAEAFVKRFPNTGAIYQPPLPHASSASDYLEATARLHANLGLEAPRFDRARYTGNGRTYASTEPDDDWILRQKLANLPVARTNSGYVAGDAPAGQIYAIVESARQSSDRHELPVEAVLPVDSSWLKQRSSELADAIETASTPVSLVLGDAGDPLATHAAVRGLLKCIAAGTVSVDRSDFSAVGAMAFGARAGSLGEASGLRHIFPRRETGGAREVQLSAFSPTLLAWKAVNHLRLASATLHERHELWTCMCEVCAGRPIGDSVWTPEHAFHHNLASITNLAQFMLTSADPKATLRGTILTGQSNSFEVASQLGKSWAPQAYLGAWHAVIPEAIHA